MTWIRNFLIIKGKPIFQTMHHIHYKLKDLNNKHFQFEKKISELNEIFYHSHGSWNNDHGWECSTIWPGWELLKMILKITLKMIRGFHELWPSYLSVFKDQRKF